MPGGVFSRETGLLISQSIPATRQPDNNGYSSGRRPRQVLSSLQSTMSEPCQPADYYETLGVQRAVSDADIKKA